jgi:hypothetical protein
MNRRVAIVNPCAKRWSDLQGEGRERYCGECHLAVYDAARYTSEELAQLWRESKGRVCTFVAGPSVSEPRSRRAVLAGALLTAISPLVAQAGRVRIWVTDSVGEPIKGAEASILGDGDKPVQSAVSDDMGEVALANLPIGNSQLAVSAPGFGAQRLTLTIAGSAQQELRISLRVGLLGESILVEPAPTPVRGGPLSAFAPADAKEKPARRRRWFVFR